MVSKYFKSNIDQNCFIKYTININDFNEFWSHDFSHIFQGYEFIIVEGINIDLNNPYKLSIMKNLLKEFCSIMTIENRVIIFHLNEFLYQLYRNHDYDDDILESLLELLDDCNFQVFEGLDYDYNDSSVYFYIGSKLIFFNITSISYSGLFG